MSASVQRGWPAVVDTVLIAGLALLALVPLAPVFDDGRFCLAGVGGVLPVSVVGVVGARLRAGVLELTGFTIVGYFLFGGVFALRESAIAGVVPSLETLRDLAVSVVFGWKNLLTVSIPVSGFDQLFAVPYLAGLIGSVLAVSFALRRRGLALLPVAGLLIFAIAFGDSSGLLPALVGGLLGGIGLGWETWRRKRDRASLVVASSGGSEEARRARLRQLSLGTAALLLAGAVGTGAAAAASGNWDRSTLREQVVPPLEVHAYASPLMSFRKFIEDGDDSTLFTVSGLPAGGVIRIASLDLYDGIVYKVSGGGGAASGVFARVGRDIPGEAAGEAATVRVRIQDLRGVWLPAAGNLAGIEFGGPRADDLTAGMHYNRATSTAVQTAGVAEGDTYTLDARIPVQPSSGELNQASLAQIATPVPEMIPDAISDRLNEAVTGTESPIKQVQAIQDYLTSKGYVSHGLEGDVASRPGHTFERLSAMLNNQQMIGDDEQYAVVMA
ncbi:MAG: hypothetical protein IPL43_12155 [Micropruina sp.]|nr:hypothetical protein [Micropruina sp.]